MSQQHPLVFVLAFVLTTMFSSLVFQNRNGNIVERDCILFHYTPRSQPISFLQNTPLLDESGLVKVNPYTLQNPEYKQLLTLIFNLIFSVVRPTFFQVSEVSVCF
jgi:hypothetical protein